MPTTVVKTIGSAGGRDYATMSLWIAACPANLVTADEIWEGQLYKDSDFDESLSITGITTDATRYIYLHPASGQGHTGKAGTGVRLKRTGAIPGTDLIYINAKYTIFEGIEITFGTSSWAQNFVNIVNVVEDLCVIRRNIIHGVPSSVQPPYGINGIWFSDYSRSVYVVDNIVYGVKSGWTGGCNGISGGGVNGSVYIENNTVYNCEHGIYHNINSGGLYNNIAVGNPSYDFSIYNPAIADYNISTDSTATGTHSLTGKTAANQFVSITAGSEDLHLKTGSDAIGKGNNLGSTKQVNIDIDAFDRTSVVGLVWDIGAHQKVRSVGRLFCAANLSGMQSGGQLFVNPIGA